MAVGRIADYADQVAKLWSTKLYAQAEKMTFWQRFEGPEGSTMPVIRKDDLEKGAADEVKYDIVLSLAGAGTTGDEVLSEGNEEKVKFRQIKLTLDPFKHAVRWSWMAEQQITHSQRVAALNQLRKWLAGKLDNRVFNELVGDGSTTLPDANVFYVGDASSINTIDIDNKLTLDNISEAKAYAKETLQIEPMTMGDEDGTEVYGLVLDPFAAMHLKLSSAYQQARRDAEARGAGNPLFRGALGMWDGVILYESGRVPTVNNDDPVRVAKNIFFGAQAMCRGYGLYPTWKEQEFSYGEEIGVATRVIVGEKLNAFDLTTDGGAAAADFTAIGSLVLASYAEGPTQP